MNYNSIIIQTLQAEEAISMNSVANLPVNDASPLRTISIPESNEDLSNQVTRLAGHIAAAEYRFIKLLAALFDRRAWTHYGIKSPAHWLNYYCGIGLNSA